MKVTHRVAGIRISGKIWRNLIEDCIVAENGNGVLAWGYEGAGETEGPEYTTIRNCTSYNSVEMRRVNGPAADGTGFQLFMANRGVIEHCESYNDFIPIMLDADYHTGYYTARYNKMYASATLDRSMFGIGLRSLGEGPSFDIYYNLVVNYGDNHYETAGIFWGWHEGAVARILVANNTVYTDNARPTRGAIAFRRCDNLMLINNILVFPSSTDNYKTVVSFEYGNLESDYNMFQKIHSSGWVVNYGQWPNNTLYSDLAAWRTASRQDMNSLEGDPLFNNIADYDFTLQSGSPAIEAGVTIPDIPQFDIEGNPLPDNPSMGAFQYVFPSSRKPVIFVPDAEKPAAGTKPFPYSHPAGGSFSISVADAHGGPESFRILDLSGKIVHRGFIKPGVKNVQLPGHLTAGTHIVEFLADGLPCHAHRLIITK